MNRFLLSALLSFVVPALASAQVGYTPERSPFRDLEYRQEISLIGGYYRASSDPAGVAPRSGPMIGARYEVRVGGPAQFMARVARVSSEHQLLNPASSTNRDGGIEPQPLYLADIGLSLNLSGQKSWHNTVPVLLAGIGLASTLGSKADSGGYRFGTGFAFSFGAGVRWVPGGQFELRADISDHLYRISYPDSYYLAPVGGGLPVLPLKQPRALYRHNAALTVGASYLFFR